MPHGAVPNIGLCDLLHGNGGLHTHRQPQLFQRIRYAERIDGSCQHAHVVCTGAVHLSATAPAPEIASAYDNGNLNAHVHAFFNRAADAQNRLKINAMRLVSRKGLPAQL